MRVEFIGLATFLFGLIGLIKGPPFDVCVFLVSLLFGAAAAIILESFGSANLLPAHVMLGFLALGMLRRPDALGRGWESLKFGRAGFWLLVTVVWSVFSAFFLPRLFAGATDVFTVARGDSGPGLARVPLAPVSGNVTQTIYILGDFVCFVWCASFASARSGLHTLRNVTLFCAFLNLLFAALDYATFASGTADLLAFMRNATYRMLDDVEIVGFKRLVGSFPEASTFAYATLGFFAFAGRLALSGVKLRLTAPLAVLSACALVASTSTTAYAGFAICALSLYCESFGRLLARGIMRPSAIFIGLAPLILACVVLGALLYEPIAATAQELLEKTIFQKATSSSAIERSLWNHQALVNFADTMYLGAGVGSVRASSFPIAVLASIGVPGALAYGAFLYRVLFARSAGPIPAGDSAIRTAARFACFAQLLAGLFAGTFIDLGLQFFVFAGMATARCESPRAVGYFAEDSSVAAPSPA